MFTKCHSLLPVLAMTVVASAQGQDVAGPYDRLVILNATVIDGTGSPPQAPMSLVVEGNRITSLVAGPVDTAGASRVIDATGKYVMPGIIDAHTHMGGGGPNGFPFDYIPKLWLGHGITTVRVFSDGGEQPEILLARRQANGQPTTAPDVLIYQFWRGDDARFWTPEGAREIVREWKREGRAGVKITGKPGLLPDIFAAIVSEADAQRMRVAVHIGGTGVSPMNALAVASAGATTIEHHYGYAESSFTDQTVQNFSADFDYSDELKRFRASGAVWDEANLDRLYGPVLDSLLSLSVNGRFVMVPTFSVYEDQTDLARAKSLPWLEEYTHPRLMERWIPDPDQHGSFYFEWTSGDEATWGRLYLKWMPLVQMFKNRGGHVAVGSDTGTSYHLYGFGTIRELELLQRAGFHPLEIVRSATQESAYALGLDDTGVIRPGYQADLLVLSENPLEDFKALYGTGMERVSREGQVTRRYGLQYTITNGRVIDARAMLRDVAAMVRQAHTTDGGGK